MAKSRVKLPSQNAIQAERFKLQSEVTAVLDKAREFSTPQTFVDHIFKITMEKYEEFQRFVGYRKNYHMGVRAFISANEDSLATELTNQRRQAEQIATSIAHERRF